MISKRGAKSGAHILGSMGGIPSGPSGLETPRERNVRLIFIVLIQRRNRDTVGEEEARDIGKWGKVELKVNREAKTSAFAYGS